MSLLKLSDLVSGGICVAYDVAMGKKMSASKFGEQVVYRSLGRKINEMTAVPTVNIPYVKENDLYAGGVAVLDSKFRQNQGTTTAAYSGVRALVSSLAADYALNAIGQVDKVLI